MKWPEGGRPPGGRPGRGFDDDDDEEEAVADGALGGKEGWRATAGGRTGNSLLLPGDGSVLIQSELTGGGSGFATVEMFTSEMISKASCELQKKRNESPTLTLYEGMTIVRSVHI